MMIDLLLLTQSEYSIQQAQSCIIILYTIHTADKQVSIYSIQQSTLRSMIAAIYTVYTVGYEHKFAEFRRYRAEE